MRWAGPPPRPRRPAAAIAAAIVYQLSPYVLPYVSRTSVMLLPWAGLGWLVGLTVRRAPRAADGATPALFALVVLTVGAVNATALADDRAGARAVAGARRLWQRTITWRTRGDHRGEARRR